MDAAARETLESLRLRARGVIDAETRARELGAVFVLREDPRLVVCDPNLVASARPLARLVPGNSSWMVRMVEARVDGVWRVVAAVAESVDFMAPRRARKKRGGAAPPLALQWERALFEGGAETYPVDHATAAITDATCAESLRANAALRVAVLAKCNGPPGCHLFEHAGSTCDIAWFSAGRGDGRYGAWWGLDTSGVPVALVAPFEQLAASHEERSHE